MSDGNPTMNKRGSAEIGTGGFGFVRPGDMASVDAACRAFLLRRGLRTEHEILQSARIQRINAERKARQ